MDENLAKDFVAVWQSELTAMAADRELREGWAAILNLWAQAAGAAAALLPHNAPLGGSSTAQPPRPAPAAVASGPGVDAVEQLSCRVAELEQRVAELLEQRDGPGPAGTGKAV
jgi:hypothetical protein